MDHIRFGVSSWATRVQYLVLKCVYYKVNRYGTAEKEDCYSICLHTKEGLMMSSVSFYPTFIYSARSHV